jgi:site-specific DNA-adenine methylase
MNVRNPAPAVSAIASYFGANRILAPSVGRALKGCSWAGIPFCGGLSEVPFIEARSIVCNDANGALINLARVMADPKNGPALYRRLRRCAFHPKELAEAQDLCRRAEDCVKVGLFGDDLHAAPSSLEWAEAYFKISWMGRGGQTGTKSELKGGMSVRYDGGGGDSNTRFRSAASSIVQWRRTIRRCNFICGDGFDFIADIKDISGNGIYVDPPWFEKDGDYKHDFNRADHIRLSGMLEKYRTARVVIRYGDCELVRTLYPAGRWKYIEQTSRAQSNKDVDEVLITNQN